MRVRVWSRGRGRSVTRELACRLRGAGAGHSESEQANLLPATVVSPSVCLSRLSSPFSVSMPRSALGHGLCFPTRPSPHSFSPAPRHPHSRPLGFPSRPRPSFSTPPPQFVPLLHPHSHMLTFALLPAHSNVLARLQALFPSHPPPPSPQPSQSSPLPSPLPPKPLPKFIKVRILTWNMHDSLPKVCAL